MSCHRSHGAPSGPRLLKGKEESTCLNCHNGRVARMTNSTSEFGKEMDSLADVVSFGVAPAVIVWQLAISLQLSVPHERIILVLLGVYVACAALRLARYNVETDVAPPNLFFGLPSPAAAG